MAENGTAIAARYGNDRTRLIDMLWDVQRQDGFISRAAMEALGAAVGISANDVHETASFYHFFRTRPFGGHAIYLCDSVVGRMSGHGAVRTALGDATGTPFGAATGSFGLDDTPCIGLSDQEPAMLVDDVVFTRLTPQRVQEIVAALKLGVPAAEIANPDGHAPETRAYVDALVDQNIRAAGPVFFGGGTDHGAVLRDCLDRSPDEVIIALIESSIRGRGGAGFPTGLKWRFARDADGDAKYIICNADEGEPGTFKDRALLAHSPMDVLLGMVIAGFAVGAREGILYLRAEYRYLEAYLEAQLDDMRARGLLGNGILGTALDFDIRIQMGAGSYVCGDETALIESCEGKRGTPRVKPPFPIQSGYLGKPTVVNNVETLAAVTRIMEKGPRWYAAMGTDDSSGTRLLSVSGDCDRPGIYEVEWGITLNAVLKMVGARAPKAVQISGPSGECVSVAQDGERRLCHSDLSCGGSVMVFDETRDLLEVARHFTRFFVDESCGICTPCRAGGVAMMGRIDRVIAGRAVAADLEDCRNWAELMRRTSRCGLGTTAAKPILTTLRKFPEVFEERLAQPAHALRPSFDADAAVSSYDGIVRSLEEEEAL